MTRRMCEAVHHLPVRVYYEDTDSGGVVYHASYLRFMERGRTEYIRARGITQSELRDEAGEPLAFVVRHMAIEFLRPGRLDDLLTVETRLSKRGGASAVMDQRVMRGDTALATASVTVVLVGGGRARRIPAQLAARMFGEPDGSALHKALT
jgi:acyl-CoA thioester hydrolase